MPETVKCVHPCSKGVFAAQIALQKPLCAMVSLFLCRCGRKNIFFILLQQQKQQYSQHAAGKYFSQAHGEHEIGDGAGNVICEIQHHRHDQRVGHNGRQRGQPFAAPQQVRADSAQQCCQTAEYYIP